MRWASPRAPASLEEQALAMGRRVFGGDYPRIALAINNWPMTSARWVSTGTPASGTSLRRRGTAGRRPFLALVASSGA
jgi:hypothetical protein